MTEQPNSLCPLDYPKQRTSFTFAMYFYLTYHMEPPILADASVECNQANYLYLLLTGEAADFYQGALIQESLTISGQRGVVKRLRNPIIADNGQAADYMKNITYSNEINLVKCLRYLFLQNKHLLNADDWKKLKKLDSRQYLTEVFRISVRNSRAEDALTKEEKDYLKKVYNDAIDLPDSFFAWEEDLPSAHPAPRSPSIQRRDLWWAGKHWLTRSKAGDGRFSSLHISGHLFPLARKKAAPPPSMDIYVRPSLPAEEAPGEMQLLSTALSLAAEQRRHIYLLGEGGMGKTTSAFHIMETAYQAEYTDTCQIPLFIELSGAPDTPGKLYENGVSTFIRRAIYKQICDSRTENTSVKQVSQKAVNALDEAFMKEPEEAVFPIEDLLSRNTDGTPEYLLILDGLNECSRTVIEDARETYRESVVGMIMGEINDLATNYPNVRILLTGRVDEAVIGSKNVTRLELSGIDDDSIQNYLAQCGWEAEQINTVFADPLLVETLRIPLFLTLFAPLGAGGAGVRHISSRGEIFRTFFHEQEVSPVYYTMQNRAQQVERDLAQAASAKQRCRITAKMLYFILDFVLPELAWHMVESDRFTIDTIDASDILSPLLQNDGDLDVCGKYGRRVFQKLRSSQSSSVHTGETAKKFLDIFGPSMDDVTEHIFDLAALSLGILTSDGQGNYRFLHQHIRDYFASRKVLNALSLALFLQEKGKDDLAFTCLHQVLGAQSPDHTLRRFLGEALGEHKNVPRCKDGRWIYSVPDGLSLQTVLDRTLNICRGRHGREAGRVVQALLHILMETRRDLSGVCLDGLDLRKCALNGVTLSAPGLPATLRGTRLNRENLFPSGHTAPIRSISFHPKDGGQTLLTSSWDGTIKLWDTANGLCRKTITGPDSSCTAEFSPTGDLILLHTAGQVSLLNSATGEQVDTLPGFILDTTFSADGSTLATASQDRSVRLWACRDGRYHCFKTLEFSDSVCSVRFHPREHILLAITDSDQLILRDLDRGTERSAPLQRRNCTADFSPDGTQILLRTFFGVDGVWDTRTLRPADPGIDGLVGFQCARYSPDGKKLLLLSYNNAVIRNLASGQDLADLCADMLLSYEAGCFSPDGRRVALGDGSSVKIYDSFSGALLLTLSAALPHTADAQYSPNGRLVITAGSDGTARLWDMERRVCLRQLKGNDGALLGAAFSPDGSPRAVTASRTSVCLWDTDTGEPVFTLSDRWLSGPPVFFGNGEKILFPEVTALTFVDAASGSVEEQEILDRVI